MSTTDEKIDAGLYVQDQGVIANFDLVLFVFHTRSSKDLFFFFFVGLLFGLFVCFDPRF